MQKLSFAIFFQLVAVVGCVLDYGSYQKAQAENQVVQLSTDTYPVKVACDLDMSVGSGKYDSVDENIFQKYFPMPTGCVEGQAVEIRLLAIPPGLKADEATAEIGKVGYRPASAWEFFSLGNQHPDLQRKFSITTIAPWVKIQDRIMVPTLTGGARNRSLGLCWASPSIGWCNVGQVAAVRK